MGDGAIVSGMLSPAGHAVAIRIAQHVARPRLPAQERAANMPVAPATAKSLIHIDKLPRQSAKPTQGRHVTG